jgi:excisionase family DNA binding protein
MDSVAAFPLLVNRDNLTPKQTAELLNVPETTLAVWRSTNRVVLPFFKLGHHVRYRRSDIEQFIERNLRNAASETAR